MPRLARPLAWYPSLLDGDKGGSWGRSAPGMWTCVADLDWPPGFSAKSCDSGEFCTTKHPHRKVVIGRDSGGAAFFGTPPPVPLLGQREGDPAGVGLCVRWRGFFVPLFQGGFSMTNRPFCEIPAMQCPVCGQAARPGVRHGPEHPVSRADRCTPPLRNRPGELAQGVRLSSWIGCRVVAVDRVGTQDATVASIRPERGPVELGHPPQVGEGRSPRMLTTMHRTIQQVEDLHVSARRPGRADIRGRQFTRAHAARRGPLDRLA